MAKAQGSVVAGVPAAQSSAAGERGVRRRLPTWLLVFVTFSLLYVLTANGRIVNRDGEAMFQVARSLLATGDVAVPAEAVFADPVGQRDVAADSLSFATETATPGRDGRLYSKYGLAQSLLMLPLLMLAGPLAQTLPGVSPFFLERFAVSFVNPLVTAATVTLLYAAGRALELAERPAMATAIAYGLATIAWPYARSTFSEPATGFGLVLCFAGLLAWRRRGGALLPAVAGAGLGLAVLSRPAASVAGPALVAYALWVSYRRGSLRSLWPFAVLLAAAIAVLLGYNVIRFGSPWETGYRTASWLVPIPVGLFGLLLSPGKGVFWYDPVLFAALAGALLLWRRFPAETAALALVAGCWLVFHSAYQFWEGGWSWGPRLLLPILPLAMLPLGLALEQRLVRRVFPVLFAIGLLVQIPAIGADYTRYLWATHLAAPQESYDRLVYRPLSSPLLGQWGAFLGVVWNATADGGLIRQRAAVAEQLATLTSSSNAEVARSVAVLDRSALVGINVPDLWFVHLYLFGGPLWLVSTAVVALAGGLAIAAVALGRRLAVQPTVTRDA